jgi:hypothetical protein
MSISFTQRVITPDDVLVRELEGQSVLLNLETEHYFSLDEVGTRMWELLTGSASIQAAYDALLTEYDVAPDLLRTDLQTLIERLELKGLLTLSDAPAQ